MHVGVHCMKSKYKNIFPKEVKRVTKQFDDREKYYQSVVCDRFEKFDGNLELSLFKIEDTIEYHLDRKSELSALKKALSDLSDDERQMIREWVYFDGKKSPPFKCLAESYGISRQAYRKRLDKILMKLKPMVEYYLENS